MAGIRCRRPQLTAGSPLPGLLNSKGPGCSKNPHLAQNGANSCLGGLSTKLKDVTTKTYGPSKGKRRYGGANKQTHDDRLWDPSKGAHVAQVNHAATPTTSSPVSNELTGCLCRPKTTTYLVTDPCDPDSFDRGGVVQVLYETKLQTDQPKHNENSSVAHPTKGRRNRGRKENRGHHQQNFHDRPVYPVEEHDMFLSQDHPLALKAFLSNMDDKILARLAFGCESGVHSSTKRGYKDGDVFEQVDSLDRMMARLAVRTPSAHVSGDIKTSSDVGINMILVGAGSQFEKSDNGKD